MPLYKIMKYLSDILKALSWFSGECCKIQIALGGFNSLDVFYSGEEGVELWIKISFLIDHAISIPSESPWA